MVVYLPLFGCFLSLFSFFIDVSSVGGRKDSAEKRIEEQREEEGRIKQPFGKKERGKETYFSGKRNRYVSYQVRQIDI